MNVVVRLKRHYRGFRWESEIWREAGHRRSPYRALVLFALSPRTKDSLLVEMCQRFFQRFPNPEALARASGRGQKEAVQLVRQGQAHFVESLFQSLRSWGCVPNDRHRLMEISGVGAKVAECVTAYGWGDDALPVDANVCRVLERIEGEQSGRSAGDANKARERLKCSYLASRSGLEKESVAMVDVHEILRLHGQVCCTRKPRCEACPLLDCRSRAVAFEPERQPAFDARMWDDWRELLLEPVEPARHGTSELPTNFLAS